MSYITTHKIGIRLVIGRIYYISIEIFRRYRCFPIALGQPYMHVFCMRGTSMGSIRKRSSISPRTKAVNVGIMLKQTNIILKYLCRDNRNRDVLPANGFLNCKVREGGWVGSAHSLPPSCCCQCKSSSDNYRPEGSIYMNKNPRKHLVQHKL